MFTNADILTYHMSNISKSNLQSSDNYEDSLLLTEASDITDCSAKGIVSYAQSSVEDITSPVQTPAAFIESPLRPKVPIGLDKSEPKSSRASIKRQVISQYLIFSVSYFPNHALDICRDQDPIR